MNYTDIMYCKVGDVIKLRKDGANFKILGKSNIVIRLQKVSTREKFSKLISNYPKVYKA